nr:PREDICTED: uncharacterized protein LOC107795997 [Nicotiana tabacum]
MGLQMQQHAGEGAAALHDYGRQVAEVAARTLQRAREDQRLGHDPAYVTPEQYQQGRGVARGRGAPRGRAASRGRSGRRGGGPQQGGVEAPIDEVGADLPGDLHEPDEYPTSMPSYNLGMQLIPGTSQVTPSGPLLIMGTDLTGEDWEEYFPGSSIAAEDRPTRDLDSGRRLSYGSSSQGRASSPPVTEAHLCDVDMVATDDYIQEPDETMVSTRPTIPSTNPASTTDDHATAHPVIKRRRDEDDPDSIAGRDGMRLRPAAALKHTCCRTY